MVMSFVLNIGFSDAGFTPPPRALADGLGVYVIVTRVPFLG
jgi:hypothetical protein